MNILIVLSFCCFYVSKSSRISISPEVPINEDQIPFLGKKLSNVFTWLQRKKIYVPIGDPNEITPEEMYIIKGKRAKSWQSNLFLIHPYLILAGFIFSLLRTLIFKKIPSEKIIVLSNAIKLIEEFDEEEGFVETEVFATETDFIPSGRKVSLLKEGFKNTITLMKTKFTCQEPFDKNGVFYYLGYNPSNFVYKNPNLTGQVTVNLSTLFKGSIATVVCHSPDDEGVVFPTYTDNFINSWLAIDIGCTRKLVPTHYCIRHGSAKPGNALRNWVLRAKVS
jgi:hypothetical protein